MGSCCVTAQCLATRALAASYMVHVRLHRRNHPSPTSATTTLACRSFMGCCLPLVIIGTTADQLLANAVSGDGNFGQRLASAAGTVGGVLRREVPLQLHPEMRLRPGWLYRCSCSSPRRVSSWPIRSSVRSAAFRPRAGAVSALVGAIQTASDHRLRTRCVPECRAGVIALTGIEGRTALVPVGWHRADTATR